MFIHTFIIHIYIYFLLTEKVSRSKFFKVLKSEIVILIVKIIFNHFIITFIFYLYNLLQNYCYFFLFSYSFRKLLFEKQIYARNLSILGLCANVKHFFISFALLLDVILEINFLIYFCPILEYYYLSPCAYLVISFF